QDLMVLGHNPGLSYFASSLSNELIQLPTAGIIAFEVAIEQWSDFRVSSSVKLIAIMKPKSF
ncbi:MAG: phosphoglycolate phosphatase, partial [Rubripirellula sp.]